MAQPIIFSATMTGLYPLRSASLTFASVFRLQHTLRPNILSLPPPCERICNVRSGWFNSAETTYHTVPPQLLAVTVLNLSTAQVSERILDLWRCPIPTEGILKGRGASTDASQSGWGFGRKGKGEDGRGGSSSTSSSKHEVQGDWSLVEVE